MENKIRVIKAYREITGEGLKESVEAINAYEDGDWSKKTIIEQAIAKVPKVQKDNRESWQEAIRNRLDSAKNTLDNLIEQCEDDFNADEIEKEALDKIADDMLTIRDRFLSRLEEYQA